MPIDWFTVAAQILNFLILVWILKRFLYRPVLDVMAKRQKTVEESMLAASREMEEAARERAGFEEAKQNLERERESTLNEARRAAEEERTLLIEKAREEFHALRQRWQETLRHEQDNLRQGLSTRVQQEALALAGQLVRDLADADLQERIVRKFISKLEEMPAADRERLTEPFGSTTSEAILRSAFDLHDGVRAEVEAAVRAVIGTQAPLRFETKPALGAGLELAVDGRKAAWTIDNYLGSLDASLRELIEKETGADE